MYISFPQIFFDNANWMQVADLEDSRRELSNAIVKSDFRLTHVEIWPFPFRNGPQLHHEFDLIHSTPHY